MHLLPHQQFGQDMAHLFPTLSSGRSGFRVVCLAKFNSSLQGSGDRAHIARGAPAAEAALDKAPVNCFRPRIREIDIDTAIADCQLLKPAHRLIRRQLVERRLIGLRARNMVWT